ncbi:hypothetical protein CHS0354_040286 [Potamilus streckersoni]|uniref:KIF-binding protein n=1 Tax=Potamilus streckersoni TaxID=2493646 RepID=A0AAE0S3S4_9BIVA|nr:hypothetical protein CHS0354_040286 [Potamilus streckersoni]
MVDKGIHTFTPLAFDVMADKGNHTFTPLAFDVMADKGIHTFTPLAFDVMADKGIYTFTPLAFDVMADKGNHTFIPFAFDMADKSNHTFTLAFDVMADKRNHTFTPLAFNMADKIAFDVMADKGNHTFTLAFDVMADKGMHTFTPLAFDVMADKRNHTFTLAFDVIADKSNHTFTLAFDVMADKGNHTFTLAFDVMAHKGNHTFTLAFDVMADKGNHTFTPLGFDGMADKGNHTFTLAFDVMADKGNHTFTPFAYVVMADKRNHTFSLAFDVMADKSNHTFTLAYDVMADKENHTLTLAYDIMDDKGNPSLCINFIDTEEVATGEEHINKCIDSIEKYHLDPRTSNIYQNALNQLGILWTGRREYNKSLNLLLQAESIYKAFKHEVGGAPWSYSEYFKPLPEDADVVEHERAVKFEDTYTYTTFYIAQVYGKLNETQLSAVYCHETLQRQLSSGKYDPQEWCLHAATISQYYMTVQNFTMSRHCLACAEVVYQEAEVKYAGAESDDIKEKLMQSKADIARCWTKYGLAVLECSKAQLMKEVESTDEEEPGSVKRMVEVSSGGDHNADRIGNQNGVDAVHDEESSADKKMEQRFQLETTGFEEMVTDMYVKDFAEAREVFLQIQKWINVAKDFYKIDTYCNDYVEIIQDHSAAFKNLAFFELRIDRQCKMHKRRIVMLSAVLKLLNPQFYLLICRQLMFELADTYSAMLDLKVAAMEQEGSISTSHAVTKINLLTKESIEKYQEYLTSLKGGKSDYPDEFSDMDTRPALVAMFCIGRLFSKYIISDIQVRIANMVKSQEAYKFVVDYCERHPSAAEKVKAELEICKEMVLLMPIKMEKLRQQYTV